LVKNKETTELCGSFKLSRSVSRDHQIILSVKFWIRYIRWHCL